jgi:4a-hydroxytetrahydrobiopterin dehydratase
MEKLSQEEVKEHLTKHLKEWSFENNSLRRELKFKTFVDAFSFMTVIAFHAEKMDHHPDWTNVYNKVNIVLNTHSANGITQNDFDLAEIIDSAYRKYQVNPI